MARNPGRGWGGCELRQEKNQQMLARIFVARAMTSSPRKIEFQPTPGEKREICGLAELGGKSFQYSIQSIASPKFEF